MNLIIPENYNPVLDLRDTEIAIKLVKDFFETELSRALNLTRVSAPIMVTPESGLNDNLNGVERPVSFDVKETGAAGWPSGTADSFSDHSGNLKSPAAPVRISAPMTGFYNVYNILAVYRPVGLGTDHGTVRAE